MDRWSWLGVALGGAVGALARTVVSVTFARPQGWPWATLGVNVLGTAILATLTTWVLADKGLSPRWHATLGAGFCGGLTTFSTFTVEIMALGHREGWGSALGYGGLSLGLALAVVVLIFWCLS